MCLCDIVGCTLPYCMTTYRFNFSMLSNLVQLYSILTSKL